MRANRFARRCGTLAFLAIGGAAAPAAAIDDILTTRGVGAAEALRAQGSGGTALFLNPAGMAGIKQYAIEGNYQYRPEDSSHMAAGSIVDSVTAGVAAGIYVHYLTGSPELGGETLDRSGIEGGLGLAYAISEGFLLGFKGKYLNADQDAPPGEDPVDISAFSFDAGAVLRFGGLALGVTGNSLNAEPPEWRKQLGLAAGYTFGSTLLLEFDALLDFDKNEVAGRDDEVAARYSGALELFLANAYALRGGAIHDRAEDSTWIAFGGGIFNPGSGLEVGVRQQIDGGDETLVSVGLKLFVQ
jgi:hypothetical protein